MILKTKRGNLKRLQQLMRMVTELKPAFAVKFFKDTKKVTTEVETTLGSIEVAKPAKLDGLQKEFKNLQSQAPDKTQADVLKDWEQGKEFQKLFDEYREAEKEILTQEVEIMFNTVFTEKDLPKVTNVEVGEMLVTYFMKQ